MQTTFWALCLAGLLSLIGTAHAATPVPHNVLTGIPKPLSGVTVEHVFPNLAQTQQIVVGEEVSVLISVRNANSAPINVTYIAGSINSPSDFRIHVQNLTTMAYWAPIPNNGERSFEYRFRTDPRMPPRDFLVALTVFYNDLSADLSVRHAQTFFNRTLEVVEADKIIDTEAFSLYLTLLAILGGILYVIYSAVKDQPWFKTQFKKATKKGKKAAAAAAAEQSLVRDKSDYLVGTSYHLDQKRKSFREKDLPKKGQ